ncbi:hypothetical protein B566_EDAN002202 [Ephemera danica]|nr:hypothetical protein B566_EDAN002202 [Ephemera danica]
MVNGRVPTVHSKTYVTPRRPFEKARLDQELKIIGEYGLRNKREVWRVKYSLAKIRKAARELLTLEEKEPKRLFEVLKLHGLEEVHMYKTISNGSSVRKSRKHSVIVIHNIWMFYVTFIF